MPSREQDAADTDSDRIEVRIAAALPTLTPVQRRMAEFVSGNVFRAATMRIDEFAGAVGVSNASANRFARALGFEGYPQFRTCLVRGFEATMAPVERLRDAQASGASTHDICQSSLALDIENLQSIARALDPQTCERAVTMLLGARRIFVLGFGASAYLAGLTEYGLAPYCAHVESLALTGGATHVARRLFDITADDLVIAITFPRYVRDTVVLAERARAYGAQLLVITDSPSSALAPVANEVFYVQAQRHFGASSDAAVLGLIQAICAAVAHRSPRSVSTSAALAAFLLPWIHEPKRDNLPHPPRPADAGKPPSGAKPTRRSKDPS